MFWRDIERVRFILSVQEGVFRRGIEEGTIHIQEGCVGCPGGMFRGVFRRGVLEGILRGYGSYSGGVFRGCSGGVFRGY